MPKVTIKKAPKQAKNGASLTPLTDNLIQLNGPSHKKGGIPFMGIEAEGGETAMQHAGGDTTIFGNMINPLTGRKFKQDSKELAKKEQKLDKLIAKGAALVNAADPKNKWQELSFNSGEVMLKNGLRKKQEIKGNLEHLASIQQAMLDMAGEMGADPGALSRGKLRKAKDGMKLKAEDGWKFQGTQKDKLDKKILEFISMLEKKGFKGSSKEKSGYDKRNTTTGKPSRHSMNQALDMYFDSPEAYEKIKQDPELARFLIDNGLTMINEYDPSVQKKTQKGPNYDGHIHLGYDKGTKTADQFRQEVAALYKKDNKWNWNTVVPPASTTPIPGAPVGDDAATFMPPINREFAPFDPYKNQERPFNPRAVQTPAPYGPDFHEPTPLNPGTNAKGLSLNQVIPEMYAAATNQLEPVWMQQYNPQLYQDYRVSFQDRLNENRSSFSSLSRLMQEDPAALSTLAAQKYGADNQVLGEEFRTNQAIEQDVVNKNIALLNDAQLKNLGFADTQYSRQAQAKSNTKQINLNILNSVTGKIAQNNLEQMTLKIYENMYPYYRFDPVTGQKVYKGPSADEALGADENTQPFVPNLGTSTKVKKDANGKVLGTTETSQSLLDQQLKQSKLYNENMLKYTQQFGIGKRKKSDYSSGLENGGLIKLTKTRYR
jgi:hypothetical protein